MPTYKYSELQEPGTIRLLRLLPDKNEDAPIKCHLFDHLLEDSGYHTHLYEALSYVWGSPDKPNSITIDQAELPITISLFSALKHLRDRHFERVMWIDAICINQNNLEERAEQVQLMAKIYGRANRVIVWLGEAADDSDEALHQVLLARSKEPTGGASLVQSNEMNWDPDTGQDSKVNRKAVFALLHRKWFRRIWVLQEVGAARHVLVMCGSTVVDGYAFCLGLQSLKLFYESESQLQNLIRSVTLLIKASIFRPRYSTPDRAESLSSGIRPLGELIEMYQLHEATDLRDKIFALLGMSADRERTNTAGLSPNYDVVWHVLLERLVRFLLGSKVFVKTWPDKEVAVIDGQGVIHGKILSVETDRDGKQYVLVSLSDKEGDSWFQRKWIMEPSAKSVQPGDLVCQLSGASSLTIVRLRNDHFVIIVIAANPVKASGAANLLGCASTLSARSRFSYHFLLVWDWTMSQEELQNGVEYDAWLKSHHQGPSKSDLGVWNMEEGCLTDRFSRLRDAALILESAEYVMGLWTLRDCYNNVFGNDSLPALTILDRLAALYRRKGQWKEAEEVLEENIRIRLRVHGESNPRTLSSIQSLVATYKSHGSFVKKLISSQEGRRKTERTYISINPEEAGCLARSFDEKELELVFDEQTHPSFLDGPFAKAVINSGKTATGIMLLEQNPQVRIRSEDRQNTLVVAGAMGLEQTITSLLQVEIDIDAASRLFGSELYAGRSVDVIMMFWISYFQYEGILDFASGDGATMKHRTAFVGHLATNLECGTALLWASKNGHEKVVELLLANGANVNFKSDLGTKAVSNMMFITTEGALNVECGMTPLLWAARKGHETVVKLLLESGADVAMRTLSGETALLLAASRGHEMVVSLLLEYGSNVSATDAIGRRALELSAEAGHRGVVRVLLDLVPELGLEYTFEQRIQEFRDSMRMPALEINGDCCLTLKGRSQPFCIDQLIINGGFFGIEISYGSAELVIKNLEVNGGVMIAWVSGEEAQMRIGNIKINDGSVQLNSSGEGAHILIENIVMSGGSFRSKAYGQNGVIRVDSLSLGQQSISSSKAVATTRTGEKKKFMSLDHYSIIRFPPMNALNLADKNNHKEIVQLFLNRGWTY